MHGIAIIVTCVCNSCVQDLTAKKLEQEDIILELKDGKFSNTDSLDLKR